MPTKADRTKKASAEDCKTKGNACLKKKQYDQAIAWYTIAMEKDPTNHVFVSNRSAAHLKNGDPEKALIDGNACINIHPTWAKGFNRKGCALHALKRYDEAIATFEAGLKIAPDSLLLTRPLRQSRHCTLMYDAFDDISKHSHKESTDPMENLHQYNAYVAAHDRWSTPLLTVSAMCNKFLIRDILNRKETMMDDIFQNALYVKTRGINGYRGCGIHVKDPIGDSVMHWAVKGGDNENTASTLILLKQLGADIDAKNDYNWTVLMRAASNGDVRLVKTLVKLGANIHHRQVNGQNALYCAADFGSLPIVKMLAHLGADINVKGMNSETPIMRASSHRNVPMIRLLGSLGAELNHKTHNEDWGCNNRKTSRARAEREGWSEVGKIEDQLHMCARGRLDCRTLLYKKKKEKHIGKKCGGCRVVMYCCVEHQKNDWPLHKKTCKKLQKLNKVRALEQLKWEVTNADDKYLHEIPSEKEVEVYTKAASTGTDVTWTVMGKTQTLDKSEYIAELHLFLKGGIPIQCFSCGRHTTGVRACFDCDATFFCKNGCDSTKSKPTEYLCQNQKKWLWPTRKPTNKKMCKMMVDAAKSAK